MTKLGDIGEFGFIKRFAPQFLNALPKEFSGIGDDCAVMRLNDLESLLVTTDMLIEDRHFLLSKISAYELGYKSLAVNISDIAAMGGKPQSAFLSIGIPSKLNIAWLDDFFKGIRELCEQTGTYLLGGDTTSSPDRLVINIALIGRADNDKIKFRHTAKSGDFICVTDVVGDSGGGLKLLLENNNLDDEEKHLVMRHHMPRPHLEEGQWLARQKAVHAMQDVSDGIESDIRRIMEQSQVGAHIDLEKIPVSDTLQKVCSRHKWDAANIGLSGGEDYCLLLTVEKDQYNLLNEAFIKDFGHPLYQVGRIVPSESGLQMFHHGKPVDEKYHGFDHFKK